MFKNYFIVAFRNFWRGKIFSLINVIGLAIGISASLVIYLIVNYDFSFDKFEKDGDRIYRVVSNFSFAGESYKNSGVPSPMGKAVGKELTGLDKVAAFRTWNEGVKVSILNTKRNTSVAYKRQKHIVFVDENYFNIFKYQWVAGSAKTSLQQPYQVVLSEAIARQYFSQLPVN